MYSECEPLQGRQKFEGKSQVFIIYDFCNYKLNHNDLAVNKLDTFFPIVKRRYILHVGISSIKDSYLVTYIKDVIIIFPESCFKYILLAKFRRESLHNMMKKH